jgi:nitrogen regulatory protein PII
MESSDVLITCIVTHGDAYDIMSVAREAGARGGTIVNAHGTHREDDVQFFGMTLASEKEMLLIVTERSQVESILNAIKNLPVFKRTGGGIIYTTEVNRVTSITETQPEDDD